MTRPDPRRIVLGGMALFWIAVLFALAAMMSGCCNGHGRIYDRLMEENDALQRLNIEAAKMLRVSHEIEDDLREKLRKIEQDQDELERLNRSSRTLGKILGE